MGLGMCIVYYEAKLRSEKAIRRNPFRKSIFMVRDLALNSI